MDGIWVDLIGPGISLFLIGVAFISGKMIESRHYRSIQRREEAQRDFLVTNLKRPPSGTPMEEGWLCRGSVVIGSDYFKRFGASLKTLYGGRLRTLETLLERGRREAILRMIEEARAKGADMIINVRLETATIGGGPAAKAFASGEVFAYGTALRTKK